MGESSAGILLLAKVKQLEDHSCHLNSSYFYLSGG